MLNKIRETPIKNNKSKILLKVTYLISLETVTKMSAIVCLV